MTQESKKHIIELYENLVNYYQGHKSETMAKFKQKL